MPLKKNVVMENPMQNSYGNTKDPKCPKIVSV